MKKEYKSEKLQMRLTPKEKEQIKEYAASHNMTISQFVLFACNRVFKNL